MILTVLQVPILETQGRHFNTMLKNVAADGMDATLLPAFVAPQNIRLHLLIWQVWTANSGSTLFSLQAHRLASTRFCHHQVLKETVIIQIYKETCLQMDSLTQLQEN